MNLNVLICRTAVVLSMIVLTACAPPGYRAGKIAKHFSNHTFPKSNLIERTPVFGEQQTAKIMDTIYSEHLGPTEGARLLSGFEGETWAYSYKASKGQLFSSFGLNKDGAAAYCTAAPIISNSLTGGKGGCLIDHNNDGTFDEIARINDLIDTLEIKAAGDDLVPAIPYEAATISDPEFITEMRISFKGIKDGQMLFDVGGWRKKGAKLPDNNWISPDRVKIPESRSDKAINIDGVMLTIHKATDTEITYTVTGGSFQNIQILHPLHHFVVRRSKN